MTSPGILNTYTVTTQVALLGQIAAGSMIYNSDTVNAIYVGPSSATSATNGLRIGPLGSVTWTLDAPCYALSSAGSVQVIVTSNASDLSSPLDIAEALNNKPSISPLGSWHTDGTTFIVPLDMSLYTSFIVSVTRDNINLPVYGKIYPTIDSVYCTIDRYLVVNGYKNKVSPTFNLGGMFNGVILPATFNSNGNELDITTFKPATITLSSYDKAVTDGNQNLTGASPAPITLYNSQTWISGNSWGISYPSTETSPVSSLLLNDAKSLPPIPSPPYPTGNCLITGNATNMFAYTNAEHTSGQGLEVAIWILSAGQLVNVIPNTSEPIANINVNVTLPGPPQAIYWSTPDPNAYVRFYGLMQCNVSITVSQA